MSGVQRAMLEILSRLDRKRYTPFVVCREEGDLTKTLGQMDIPYGIVEHLQRRIHIGKDLIAYRRLLKYFRQNQFNIVHSHSSKTGFLGRLAARRAGVPVIMHTVQGLPFHEFSSSIIKKIYSMAEKVAAGASDTIIFVNNEERKLAIEMGIVAENKAVTIHNGVDHRQVVKFSKPEQRRRFRRQWGIGAKDFVVGYVGRLWEQKDPETLLRIIRECDDLPVKFLIVGDGPYLPRFEEQAKLNRRIILTGWLNNPFAMYPAIDTLLLPSLWEGLSVTLLEAMAFGKPLIASNIKGNRECIWQGENGFLCQPRAPLAFKAAIGKLFRDPALRRRMGKRSRKLSAQYFDADANARAVIGLYEQALKRL